MSTTKDMLMKREGTSYQGSLLAGYEQLVALYGKPIHNPSDHKTDAEWVVVTPFGIATIYNYKDGRKYCEKDGLDAVRIREWHVGGENIDSFRHILEQIAAAPKRVID